MKQIMEHGRFDISWNGPIMTVRIAGAFNMEGVDSLHKHIYSAVKNRNHERWLRLDIIEHENTLGPIEAYPKIVNSLSYCVDQGCQHLFMVEGNIVLRQLIAKATKEVNLPISFFETKDDASLFISKFKL